MDKEFHLNKSFSKKPLDFEGICVFQIGRLYCNAETVIDTHWHTDLFELTIVTEGEGTVTTNGVPVNVKKGDIYLSLPSDAHKIESDSKELLKFDFFAFTCNVESFHNELEKISKNHHLSNKRIFKNDQIFRLIGNAIAELNDIKEYSNELLASIFRQIIIYTIRGFSDIEPSTYPSAVSESEILCYKIMNYIDTHIYSIKNLTELSKMTDYSYGYLSAIFKKTTNNTISDYYHNRKLETARMLLLEDGLKIIEISEMLNYSSVYALSKSFTKHFGVSPRNYRNNIKNT